MLALTFDLTSLFAGGIVALFAPNFTAAPWILALFPPILTIRGNISGILSGNLATMLHLGLIHPQIRGNTDVYRRLINAVFVLTFLDTLVMGMISFILNLLFGRASLGQLYIFALVPTISCTLAVSISVPLTSLIAIVAYKRGLNPDILVYPILSAINDIVVTSCFIATSFLVLEGGSVLYLLGGAVILLILFSLFLFLRNRRTEFFSQTLREGSLVVIVSSLFGSLNGLFLSRMMQGIQHNPGIVVLYPALTSTLGDIGSIVGSITTTSLALGYISNFSEEVRGGVGPILKVEAVAALMHVVFGAVAYLIVKPASPGASLSFLMGVALATNLSSFLVISVFALVVAFYSFRRGLNPDNVVIPIITSSSDTVATLSILPALSIIRILGV